MKSKHPTSAESSASHHLLPFSSIPSPPTEKPGTKYTHTTPSLSAYLQGLRRDRVEDHIVWMYPEGVDLQSALKNLHAGKCWCGRDPVTTRNWTDNGWACSQEHQRIWWKQFEFWHDVRLRVLDRDGWTCCMCSVALSKQAQVDHIKSITDGGDMWDQNNMQSLCVQCHEAKTLADHKRRASIERQRRAEEMCKLDQYDT